MKKTTTVMAVTSSSSSRWPYSAIYIFLITASIIVVMGTMKTITRDATSIIDSKAQIPDPVILPIPPSGDEKNPYFMNLTTTRKCNEITIKAHYDRHHRGYYLVTTNYPWSIGLPNNSGNNQTDGDNFNYSSSSKLSSFLQTTSQQAENHHCNIVATNGGPFDEGGRWNSGPTVSNGKLIRTKPHPEESGFVGFGIGTTGTTSSSRGSGEKSAKNRYWVIGRYGQLVPSSTVTLWDFVTGFEWLVYNGKPRVTYPYNTISTNPPNPTGAIRAPRTAVGLDKESNLMLLVVDGCQHCLFKKGLSLEELADLLVDLGAVYAINMDGGGSSTIVMPSVVANLNATKDDYATTTATANATVTTGHRKNYAVINRPTCLDIPFPHCQRAVSTVLCVSTNATES